MVRWLSFGACQAMNVLYIQSLATILELVSMREGEQKHPIPRYLTSQMLSPYISPAISKKRERERERERDRDRDRDFQIWIKFCFTIFLRG